MLLLILDRKGGSEQAHEALREFGLKRAIPFDRLKYFLTILAPPGHWLDRSVKSMNLQELEQLIATSYSESPDRYTSPNFVFFTASIQAFFPRLCVSNMFFLVLVMNPSDAFRWISLGRQNVTKKAGILFVLSPTALSCIFALFFFPFVLPYL